MTALIDPTKYFLPIFILIILIEAYYGYKHQLQLYDVKDSIASLSTGITYLLVTAFMKLVVFKLFTFLHQYAIFDIKITDWRAWAILVVLDDFTFYWFHRLSHQVRLLWASHVNHHSSVQYNFSVALRKSWADSLYKYIFWIWLPIIGFPPLMILLMISINLLYQFWVHTQVVYKLGFIEKFMNTPSHHRVHHASNINYLDRNHAGMFILWDKIFDTFQEEMDDEKPVFGITNNIHSYNLIKISTHAFADLWNDIKHAPDLITKLKYIFMPPGWSHEGENKTTKVLRKKAKLEAML